MKDYSRETWRDQNGYRDAIEAMLSWAETEADQEARRRGHSDALDRFIESLASPKD